jgi:hypothetical protein
VIDSVPAVVNVVVSEAVPPAPLVPVAATGVTATGEASCTPPLKKATVPVVPVELLLLERIVAVKVTGVAVVTPVAGAATTAGTWVAAFETVTVSVTGVVTAL